MIDVLFPAVIQKNSRIVIYGADVTGHTFAEQLRSLHYCEIVCFVDAKVEKSYLGIPVNQPEWVREKISCYDAILLGTLNTRALEEIRNKLVTEWGIDESKIIDRGYRPLLKGGGIIDVGNPKEIVQAVMRFGKSKYNADKSVKYLIDCLMNMELEGEYLAQLQSAYLTEKNYKTKITFAYLLYRSGNWNQEMMKDYQKFLLQLPENHFMWAHKAIFDVCSFVPLRHPEYRYYEYYVDRKAIMKKVSNKMLGENRKKSLEQGKEREGVAFCCNQLYGKEMHLTKIISFYANEMVKKGKKVKIFVENRHYEAEEFFLENTYGSGTDASVFRESNQSLFMQEIEIYYASGRDMREKTEDFFEKVYEWYPEVIFYYNGETSYMTYNLAKYIPIVNVMTICAGSCAEWHMLAVDDKSQMLEIDKSYKCIEDKGRLQEYSGFLIPPKAYKTISRKDLQIGEDTFVLVTVGNRLEYEIKENFVDAVCAALYKNDFVWLLVGCSHLEYISDCYYDLIAEGKIRFIPYEKDLCALYRICDVYLNPQRAGGGTSVGWAMIEKLPELTLREPSDACFWVGEKLAVRDYQDMMQELFRLYTYTAYRNTQKQLFKDRIDSFNNISNSTQELLNIAEKAVAVFNSQEC